MDEKGLSENDELLQRYHDGELDDDLGREKVESLLAGDPAYRESLRDYESLSALLRLAAPEAADELAKRRDWEKIAHHLASPGVRKGRKLTYWLGLAAAAVVLFFFYHPFGAAVENQIVVESIDCSYHSFLLLNPSSEDGHTIIWINDQPSASN